MRAKRIAVYGLITALAMILSYIEHLIPMSFAVPGIKLGLANIVVVFAIYKLRFRDACVISLVRVLLSSILFGNVFSLAYSAAGAALSLAVMGLLFRSGHFGPAGVSVGGGLAHNAGQLIVAALVLETGRIVYYLPVLCFSGTVAGVFIGITAGLLIKRLKLERS